MDSQIKVDEEQTMSQSMAIVVTIFTIILIYAFKFIIRDNFFIGFFIVIFYVFGSLIIFLLTKKPTIIKILLKNNVIELYDSNDEIKTYQLDLTNVRYNIKIYHESSAVEATNISTYILTMINTHQKNLLYMIMNLT